MYGMLVPEESFYLSKQGRPKWNTMQLRNIHLGLHCLTKYLYALYTEVPSLPHLNNGNQAFDTRTLYVATSSIKQE